MNSAHNIEAKSTAIKLRRVAPGRYETKDGQFEVVGWQRPEADDYGPAGEWQWYWRELPNGKAYDLFDRKYQAVESLLRHIENATM